MAQRDHGFEYSELDRAVLDGDADAVRRAIDCGADPNEQFNDDLSILQLAIYHGDAIVAQVLLDAGARVTPDALSPLGEADMTDWKIQSEEEEKRYVQIAELLLKHGDSPHVAAWNGEPLVNVFPRYLYPKLNAVLERASRDATH